MNTKQALQFSFHSHGIVLIEIPRRWLITNGWAITRVNSSTWCDCFKLSDFPFVQDYFWLGLVLVWIFIQHHWHVFTSRFDWSVSFCCFLLLLWLPLLWLVIWEASLFSISILCLCKKIRCYEDHMLLLPDSIVPWTGPFLLRFLWRPFSVNLQLSSK